MTPRRHFITVGRALLSLRYASGLSQAGIARAAGLHVNTYRLIEQDKISPTIGTFEKIAAVYRAAASQLLAAAEAKTVSAMNEMCERITERRAA